MPFCTIKRYHKVKTTEHEFVLPSHVTITGNENHFALANHDAQMILRGMKAEFEIINGPPQPDDKNADPARFWLHSVRLD